MGLPVPVRPSVAAPQPLAVVLASPIGDGCICHYLRACYRYAFSSAPPWLMPFLVRRMGSTSLIRSNDCDASPTGAGRSAFSSSAAFPGFFSFFAIPFSFCEGRRESSVLAHHPTPSRDRARAWYVKTQRRGSGCWSVAYSGVPGGLGGRREGEPRERARTDSRNAAVVGLFGMGERGAKDRDDRRHDRRLVRRARSRRDCLASPLTPMSTCHSTRRQTKCSTALSARSGRRSIRRPAPSRCAFA